MIKKILKEPLLHFLILGSALFVAYGWFNRGVSDSPKVLRLTEGDVKWLAETWSRQWMRQPTNDELREIVTDYMKEQVLAREAALLDLDQNDTIIRRRLAQKMEFIVKDTALLDEPEEDALVQYYEKNTAFFTAPLIVSFRHIFFNRDKRENAFEEARLLLEKMTGVDVPAGYFGDPSLLDSEIVNINEQGIEAMFGNGFAKAVLQAPLNRWAGPFESSFGWHLVLITSRQPSRVQPYEEVREQVLNRWNDEVSRQAQEEYFSEVLAQYTIEIDEQLKWLVEPLVPSKAKTA